MKHRSYFKVAAVFSLALAVSALLFTTLVNVSPVQAQVGYGGAMPGGGGHPARRLEVDLSGAETQHVIDLQGALQETIERISDDKMLILIIPEGTIALDKDNEPLKLLEITVEESPPPPPEGANIIGLVYNFEPSGATFTPSMTINFYYAGSMIPEGVAEEELILAYYNEETGEWVNLYSVVNPWANSITIEINHLTTFAILGYPHPAAFAASDLSITPDEVNPGEEVTISFTVTNTGGITGSYEIPLKIAGAVEATQEVTLAGNASKEITFTTIKDTAGTYTVTANGLSDTFTVKAIPKPATFTAGALSISPAEVEIGGSITISTRVTNTGDLTGSYKVTLKIDGAVVATKNVTLTAGASQKVTFTTSTDTAGTYTVTVNGKSGTFTVKAPPKPINWWFVALTIVVVILAGWGIRKLVTSKRH